MPCLKMVGRGGYDRDGIIAEIGMEKEKEKGE